MKSKLSKQNRYQSLIAAATTSLLLNGQAMAQSKDIKEVSTSELETIVVTGTKRPQRLLEVDGAVSVRSADDLIGAGINDIADLEATFANLIVDVRGNRNYSNYSLRGISSGDFYNPAVQVYVDGVPQDVAFLSQPLLNVKQVEVLSGSQGTLYGRNAQGGIINITSNPIKNGFETNFNTDLSDYDRNLGLNISGKNGHNGVGGALSLYKKAVTGQIDDIATGEKNIDESDELSIDADNLPDFIFNDDDKLTPLSNLEDNTLFDC